METKVITHTNSWWWGTSVNMVSCDSTAMICVKYDKKSFPYTGYICDLSVLEFKRKKGLGRQMMQFALCDCRAKNMIYARLHVDAKNSWLKEWYERLGFKELSRDENEIEMVKEL